MSEIPETIVVHYGEGTEIDLIRSLSEVITQFETRRAWTDGGVSQDDISRAVEWLSKKYPPRK